MALCVFWAFWGCWRIRDFLIDNINLLATFETVFKQEMFRGNWANKGLFALIFFIGFFYWITLPLQIMFILTIYFNSGKPTLTGKIFEVFKESFGQIFGATTLILLWATGSFFLTYFGGCLDLLGILILTGWVIFTMIIWMIKRFKK